MYSYKVTFITVSGELVFNFKSSIKEGVHLFAEDIVNLFQRTDHNSIEALQVNNNETRSRIDDLVKKYRTKVPEINGLSVFLKNLAENEKYLLLPGLTLSKSEHDKLRLQLKAHIQGRSIEQIEKERLDFFGESIKKYKVEGFGELRQKIGQFNKQKRKCRFCQKTMPEVSFNETAHAISEALGNKTVVLFDECDTCNHRFSKSIEPQLIEYLSVFRTHFGVKGKGGEKKHKGKNFVMSRDKNVLIEFIGTEPPKRDVLPYEIHLPSSRKISMQNIYRCLCKFFLSVVEDSELANFADTINWVNGRKNIEQLPLVAETTTYNRASLQPRLTIYLRKRKSKNYPYAVCEFQFTVKKFVFIVPLSNQDEKQFLDELEYKKFWNAFKHYKTAGKWIYTDFSSNILKDFSITLRGTEK